MLKVILILASVFSCTAVCQAQEKTDVLLIHLHSGEEVPFSLADVDSVTFVSSQRVHEAVDLGLSVRWATCNVGATQPEEGGQFYAWGEVAPKAAYTEESYAYYAHDQYQDIGSDISGTAYDVARQAWGGAWRMPTHDEMHELASLCTWTFETLNGVNGYRITAANGNSIFLPSAGYRTGDRLLEQGTGGFYWSGTLSPSMRSSAYNLNFRGYDGEWLASRAYGFSVRPVR